MKKIAALCLGLLLSVPALAWEPVGYSPEVTAALRAACYDPNVIGTENWKSASPFAYNWQEPQNNAQKFVWGLKTSPQTLPGVTITKNPWVNGYLAYDYYLATTDKAAYRAALLARNATGYNMSDPAVAAAVNTRTDQNMAVYFGPGSGAIFDKNGILLPYAYGYAINQPGLPSSWIRPADCSVVIPPTATPVTAGPTPTPAAGGIGKCKDPVTGECMPSIFGGACPAGWTLCGVTPTPTPTQPVVTPPIPSPTPIPGSTAGCLSADGRYAYAATSCKPDEIPLVKK